MNKKWQNYEKNLNNLLSSIQDKQEWNDDYSKLISGEKYLKMEQKFRFHRKALTKIAMTIILENKGLSSEQIKSELINYDKEVPDGSISGSINGVVHGLKKRKKKTKKKILIKK